MSTKSLKFKAKSRLDGDVEDFIDRLPFKLTNDQLGAIEQIRADLKGDYASKELLLEMLAVAKLW